MRLPEKAGYLLTGIFVLSCLLTADKLACAATIEFRILIDGVHRSVHTISPGAHQLTVEGRVTENEIFPGVLGGFIQTSFSAMDSANAVIWDGRPPGFLGSGSVGDVWKSSANAYLEYDREGELADANSDIVQETHAMDPLNWNRNFSKVGAYTFSVIATGGFLWSGTTTTLSILTSPDWNLVATLKGANIGAVSPQVSFGDSTIIQTPEPTAALLSIYAVGFQLLLMRQRRVSPVFEPASQ